MLAALTAGLAGIAGCSGDDGTATEEPTTGTPRPTTAAPATTAEPTTRATTAETTTAETTAETTTAAPDVAIEAPERVLTDDETTVRVTGADPGEAVTVRTSVEDANRWEWTAEATFAADEDGVVDLSAQAPERGTYEGVDPMGWLWSATTSDGDGSFFPDFRTGSMTVELRATAGGPAATHRMDRRLWDASVPERRITADGLVGYRYEPPGEGPHPGVLVLHGSGGRALRWRASLLASHGYATAALQYFGGDPDIPDGLREVPLSYFDRAARWFREREEVRDAPLGLLGVSRGGELALLLGARFGWVGAVAAWVPSGIVWPGPGGGPAWTVDGEPVPYLPTDEGGPDRTDEGLAHYRPAFERALSAADAEERRSATIAVEEIDAPVAMVSGTDDQLWPSTRLSTLAADRLREADVDFRFAHDAYEGAGHAILPPYLPTDGRTRSRTTLYGGTAEGYAAADPGGWERTLEFLSAGLR